MKKSSNAPKFYVYISDSKVEMLYQQIPQEVKSKLAAELKFNLQILEATFKQDAPAETRISRLKIVSEYIEKQSDIGTLDKPGEYFKGHLAMRWGLG